MDGLTLIRNATTLTGRMLLALIFVIEGWLKIKDYAGTVSYMEAYSVPGVLLPLVILAELGVGLLVAFGLFTRLAAVTLAGFCVLTALFFHTDFADTQNLQMVHFVKNLSMAGGFLVLAAFGAGNWSLDALLRRRGTAAAPDR